MRVLEDHNSFSELLTYSIAQASLIHFNDNAISASITDYYILFQILVTQAAGILFLSFLLWLYRRLISRGTNDQSIKDAVRLTIKVSLLVELILLLFFMYAIPIEFANTGFFDKLLAALMLSVNSFNNAGLSYLNQFLIPGTVQQSFIIQIGVIAGSTLGSLGIFVIDELLSPKNLRYRLKHPEVDWSLFSKLSIFGAVFIFIVFSGIFYLNEKKGVLSELNLVESIIASAFETSSARGFGYSLYNYSNVSFNSFVTLFGAGPFSTGGGFTLLSLAAIFSVFVKRHLRYFEWICLKKLSKNLFIYLFISICIFSLVYIALSGFANPDINKFDLWLILSTNQMEIPANAPWYIHLFISIMNITGRMSFIVASYITLSQIKNRHASHLF